VLRPAACGRKSALQRSRRKEWSRTAAQPRRYGDHRYRHGVL